MDYFLLKQAGAVSIPKPKQENAEEPSVRIMQDISALEKLDFLSAEALVSDRMKLLLEQYLISQEWQPCVFIEPSKKSQITFWFLPKLPYLPEDIVINMHGALVSFRVKEEDFAKKSPGIFRIPNPKGSPFIVLHLSIAESILRRGFCGLELLRLS